MGIINIIISFTGLPVVISLVVLFIFGLIPLLFPLFFLLFCCLLLFQLPGSFFLFLFLTQLPEKFREHGGTFFFQNTPGDLYLMVKSFYLKKVHDGTCTSRLGIHTADDHLIDPGLYQCPGAHLAGFQCYIHGASLQTPVSQLPAGFAYGVQLCVGQGIFVRVSSVISSGNDLPFMDDHTANGDFLQYFCLFRLADGFFHITFLFCQPFLLFPVLRGFSWIKTPWRLLISRGKSRLLPDICFIVSQISLQNMRCTYPVLPW